MGRREDRRKGAEDETGEGRREEEVLDIFSSFHTFLCELLPLSATFCLHWA